MIVDGDRRRHRPLQPGEARRGIRIGSIALVSLAAKGPCVLRAGLSLFHANSFQKKTVLTFYPPPECGIPQVLAGRS